MPYKNIAVIGAGNIGAPIAKVLQLVDINARIMTDYHNFRRSYLRVRRLLL